MSSSPDERRDDRALRAVWRELRKPRNLLSYLRKSGDLTVPLIFAGPTFVVLAYIAAFGFTPNDRATTEFHAAASQIIPVGQREQCRAGARGRPGRAATSRREQRCQRSDFRADGGRRLSRTGGCFGDWG
jgi:hypothetical protein